MSYFNKDGSLKKQLCYELALELDECECPSQDCHCDLEKDRFYDSIYDPIIDMTMCGPCAYTGCVEALYELQTNNYCVIVEEVDYHECSTESDIHFEKLDVSCVCGLCANVKELYYESQCHEMEDSPKFCLECLQNRRQDICKMLDLHLRVKGYLKLVNDDIERMERKLEKIKNKCNKEDLTRLIIKYQFVDEELTKYLRFLDDKVELESNIGLENAITSKKKIRKKLKTHLLNKCNY